MAQNYVNRFILKHAQPKRLEPVDRIAKLTAVPAEDDIYTNVLCEVGWPVVTKLWQERFNGMLSGKGISDNASYKVFSEDDYNTKLGLTHGFAATWLNGGHGRRLFVGAQSCELFKPGWGRVIVES